VDQAQQDYPPGTVGHLAQGRGWVKSTPETGPERSSTEPSQQDPAERPEDRWGDDDWADDDSWAELDEVDPAAETPPAGIQRPSLSGAHPADGAIRQSPVGGLDSVDRRPLSAPVSVPEQSRREPTPPVVRHTDELESLLEAIRVPANGAGAPPHPVESPAPGTEGAERHPSWPEPEDGRHPSWFVPNDARAEVAQPIADPADGSRERHPTWPEPAPAQASNQGANQGTEQDERYLSWPEPDTEPAQGPTAHQPAPPAHPADYLDEPDAPADGPYPARPGAGYEVHTDEDEDFEPAPAHPGYRTPEPDGWDGGGFADYPEPEPGEPSAPAEPAPTGYREPVVASWPEPEQPRPTEPAPRPMPREPRPAARWVEPGALAAQQAQRERTGEIARGGDLASARLLRPGRRPPRTGWRRILFRLTGGLINVGESAVEVRRRELTTGINQPLTGCYKIAMLSLKGGVGKTTVTATLGATFASLRGDRVIAVDANPDRGTLSQKIPLETSATVRHLLRDSQRVRRYTDVRAYTSQGPSRLEVLASEQDPAVSEAFSEQDYRRTVTLLEHFYNIVLTDCGTGLMHSAMYGVLGLADALVIVSSGSIDGARSASATMDWLDAHGHGDLVANSVAVINSVRRSSGQVDLDRVAEHFAARCRKVIRIPYDSHLEEGAELDLDRLAPTTRLALLELAASVADAFPHSEAEQRV
jgi:MinD-like ATPase involved in chromosome partitioning or flagellar assembly